LPAPRAQPSRRLVLPQAMLYSFLPFPDETHEPCSSESNGIASTRFSRPKSLVPYFTSYFQQLRKTTNLRDGILVRPSEAFPLFSLEKWEKFFSLWASRCGLCAQT
jgi:hypothetical protein